MNPPCIYGWGTRALLVPALLLSAGCLGKSGASWDPPPVEMYAASYIDGVARSLDGGDNWLPLGSDPRPVQAYAKTIAFGADEAIFIGTSGAGMFALEQVGGPYLERNQDLPSDNVRAVHLSLSDSALWAGTWGAGVFVSRDGGLSWEPENAGLTAYDVNCLESLDSGESLRRAEGPEKRLYCGTRSGLFVRDTAGPWREVPGTGGLDVRCLLIGPGTEDLLMGLGWPGRGRTLLRSRDGGAHWEPDGAGLPRLSVFCLAFDEIGNRVLAGTETGVFSRDAGGGRWRRAGRDLPGGRVFALAAAEGYAYASTARGLFGLAANSTRWVSLSCSSRTSAVTDVVVRPHRSRSP